MLFEKVKIILLDESYLPQMAEVYKKSFAGEPWNDDWSDREQLSQYIKEISCNFNALNFGLVINDELVGLSVGAIRHWWEGTNYNIEEFCIIPEYQRKGIGSRFMKLIEDEIKKRGLQGIFLQTDSDKPAYSFYHKNGFHNLDEHVSMYISMKNHDI